jgi:16S rRNA (cytosine967-C5)-methyltransferase
MKHFYARLRQLREILDSYTYPVPFSNHLRLYFQKHKQLGGRDRKEIRALSYAFFRLSMAMDGEQLETIAGYAAIFMGYHAGDEEDTKLMEAIQNAGTLAAKAAVLQENTAAFDPTFIFPFSEYSAEMFKNEAFQLSFLVQPEVWVKIHKGHKDKVLAELDKTNIPYMAHANNILSFESEAKLTELESFKEGYFRIQDLSSQQTADSFKPTAGEYWWDCCAGSGGKSLALLEKEPDIHLFVSDIRESILNNLHDRLISSPSIEGSGHQKTFSKNEINIFAADVTESLADQNLPKFDGIIIDAPCSGSGTWARNPENLPYFNPAAIADYQKRQIAILENVYPFLKTGKPLIYITCSVFTAENEDVITQFSAKHHIEIEEQKYLEGYKHGSENMFLCRMIKKD